MLTIKYDLIYLNMDERAIFYKKLKGELEKTTKFPTNYMFKFIVASDEKKIKQVEDIFDFTGAVIKTKSSKTNKFTSITIEVKMKSADDVIQKYKEAEVVEGIISL